jgi:hypothetical protein
MCSRAAVARPPAPPSPAASRRRRRTLLPSGAVVLALWAAGCSGGTTTVTATTVPSPKGSSSTAPAATAPPATAPPATVDPLLVAKAAAAVFQPADFPLTYKPQPADPQNGLHLEAIWQNLTHCMGVQDSAPPPAVATSPTFLQGLATQAMATVEYTTPSAAAAIAVALGGPMFQTCATDTFAANAKSSAPQGATPGPATVTPLTAAPTVPAGQKMFAYRINVTQNLTDLQVKLFQDCLVVINGGTVIRMLFLNPGSPFPPDLEQSLVQKVVSRV